MLLKALYILLPVSRLEMFLQALFFCFVILMGLSDVPSTLTHNAITCILRRFSNPHHYILKADPSNFMFQTSFRT